MNRTQTWLLLLLLAAAGGAVYLYVRDSSASEGKEASKVGAQSLSSPKSQGVEKPRLAAAVPTMRKDNPALPIRERLEVYRERLLSGKPITGVVIIPHGENVVSLPTAFTLGHATRIVLADRSVLEFTPALNDDGSVRYAIREMTTDGTWLTLPDLIQVPWEGFTFDAGGNWIVGFDPDEMN